MTEPSSTVLTTLQVGGTSGTASATMLAAFGLNPYALGAALLGAVAVQTLLPAERVKPKTIAATTIGSMIFSSMFTPWLAAALTLAAPASVTSVHVTATAAFMLGAFPKPVFVAVRQILLKIVRRFKDAA